MFFDPNPNEETVPLPGAQVCKTSVSTASKMFSDDYAGLAERNREQHRFVTSPTQMPTVLRIGPFRFHSIRMNPVNRHMFMSAYRGRSANFGSRKFHSPGIEESRYMTFVKSSVCSMSTTRH